MLSPLLLVVTIAASPAGSAGVVISGPDPVAAGSLQRRIEARLSGVASGADVLAPRLASTGTPRAPVVDAAMQQEGDRLIAAAERAYYEGDVNGALAQLSDLERIVAESPGMPVRTRARLLVWRAAIFLEKAGTHPAAESPLREALAIAPNLVVDERSYPPLVVALAARVKRSLKTVQVVVTGLPADARVRIDDADVPASGGTWKVMVPAGRHRLQAWGPGRELVTTMFEAAADTTIAVSLPLALEPAEAQAFAAIASGRGGADALAPLSARLRVNTIAGVVRTPAGLAGFLWHRGKVEAAPVSPATAAGEIAIADWIAARLRERNATLARGSAPPARMGWAVSAGLAGGARSREANGGSSYAATFGGAGATAAVSGRVGRWIGLGEMTWLSYGFSPVTADLPDGRSASGDGGTTIAGELAAGWQLLRPESAPSVFAAAGMGFERHTATDLRTGGAELGFFPSHTRMSLDVHGGGRYPLRALVLEGRLTVRPFSTWSEDPAGFTGRDPVAEPAFAARLGASRQRGAWLFSARYELARRTISFSGDAQAPLATPLHDAVVTETLHGFALQAALRY